MARRLLVIALLVCGVLTMVTGPAGAYGARMVTALSFNIHHAEGTDDVLDLERVARVVKASRADVVGLQEVDRHLSERSDWVDQAGELARMLDYHVVFGPNIDRDPLADGEPRRQYGTAILSRYPISDWQNTYLFRSPDQEQRGLLHAELDVRGVPVHVYNTHLAASSQTDRAEQTRQIVDLIGDTSPTVLLGDLNALPGAPEITTVDAAFTDTWRVAGLGDGATYPSERPTRRIDYIYVSDGVYPLLARVVRADPAASDHLPILCRFVVPATRT